MRTKPVKIDMYLLAEKIVNKIPILVGTDDLTILPDHIHILQELIEEFINKDVDDKYIFTETELQEICTKVDYYILRVIFDRANGMFAKQVTETAFSMQTFEAVHEDDYSNL